MPVRVVSASHSAKIISPHFATKAAELLPKACQQDVVEILQSSIDDAPLSCNLEKSSNGFVDSVIRAYSCHYHLRIRPEDIGFAILTQISFYINANAEKLRDKFVAHEGTETLVLGGSGSRYSINFGGIAQQMTRLIQENILDPDFRDWIMPGFTTSTRQDEVIASILMMGSMQKYFKYRVELLCGIPSVTLLGEKSDFEKILKKLDKLSSLGDEPSKFANLLKPVMSRMVRTFDNPEDPTVIEFWQTVMSKKFYESGNTQYSGWITAFCFWSEDGDRQYSIRDGGNYLSLDGVSYHKISSGDVPNGWCKVPVELNDNGIELETEMVAGSVGIACSSSGLETENGKVGFDTMQPESGWWIYEKKPSDKGAANGMDGA